MTKHFCDWCGDELHHALPTLIEVMSFNKETNEHSQKKHEVCGSCTFEMGMLIARKQKDAGIAP